MRYVVGRNRQAAAGQLIISIIYLLINFIYLFVKMYFPDIPDQDACKHAGSIDFGIVVTIQSV
jgi:hypothetical protein